MAIIVASCGCHSAGKKKPSSWGVLVCNKFTPVISYGGRLFLRGVERWVPTVVESANNEVPTSFRKCLLENIVSPLAVCFGEVPYSPLAQLIVSDSKYRVQCRKSWFLDMTSGTCAELGFALKYAAHTTINEDFYEQ